MLDIASTVFSLCYSILVPSLIIWTWESDSGIFGVHEGYDASQIQSLLLNLGVGGVGVGEEVFKGVAEEVYKEVYVTDIPQLLSRMFPLLLLLLTLNKIEKASSDQRVHPETESHVTSSAQLLLGIVLKILAMVQTLFSVALMVLVAVVISQPVCLEPVFTSCVARSYQLPFDSPVLVSPSLLWMWMRMQCCRQNPPFPKPPDFRKKVAESPGCCS